MTRGLRITATDTAGASASDVFDLAIASERIVNGTVGADTLVGTTGQDRMFGLAGNDNLTAHAGDDWLDGGAGADTLKGGAGHDTYVVDDAGDTITELSGQGTDLVQASLSWTLGAHLEHLSLTGTAAVNGTGNSLANTLSGNAAANVLNGSTGADTLIGGAGDDTYVVDNAADTITELADEGLDLVRSSIAWTLGAHLEHLSLTGTAAIAGTGNALDNRLTGNSGANTLTGHGGADWLDGGAGSDTLRGGSGDDTYVVDVATDVVSENADEGLDLVRSSIAWTLGANLEHLSLTGTGAIAGSGNALDNRLTGNGSANTLNGGAGADRLDGGAGADTLVGGTGGDTYVFGRGYGADTIQENDASAGTTDVLSFLAGITSEQIWLRRVSNHLEVSVIGTGDKVTISNWYLGSQYRVEQFKTADGKTLLDARVQNLVNAMAAFAPPAAGQTSLPPGYASSLQPLIAANWQ